MRPCPLPFVSAVAGVSFRQEIVFACNAGDLLSVAAVDDNPHDANAVEVRTRHGELVGFIPSALAPRLRCSGQRRWDAEIVEVLPGETWGLRIKVTHAADDRGDTEGSGGGHLAVAGGTHTGGEAGNLDDVAHADGESDGSAGSAGGVRVVAVARSGRVLGELVERDGTAVIVRDVSGRTCRYPAAAVELRAAALT
jgi:hypothetical protein